MIELMVVVAIVGILLAIAVPAYNSQVRHARRSEAMQIMQDCVLREERYRADHPTYGTAAAGQANCQSSNTYYNFTVANPTATGYTITGTAISGKGQDQDAQNGSACAVLKIIKDPTQVKIIKTSTAASTTENLACWK